MCKITSKNIGTASNIVSKIVSRNCVEMRRNASKTSKLRQIASKSVEIALKSVEKRHNASKSVKMRRNVSRSCKKRRITSKHIRNSVQNHRYCVKKRRKLCQERWKLHLNESEILLKRTSKHIKKNGSCVKNNIKMYQKLNWKQLSCQ